MAADPAESSAGPPAGPGAATGRRPRGSVVVLAFVLLAPAAWWLREAFFVPGAPVLPPALCGDWIVHPDWDVFAGGPRVAANAVFPPTVYRLLLPAGSPAGAVEVTAFGDIQVALAGRPCPLLPRSPLPRSPASRGAWQRPVRLDLAACGGAETATARRLEIASRRAFGPPPIRVCWPSGSPLPDSGEPGWTAATAGASETAAVRVLAGEAELQPRVPFPLPGAGYGALVVLLGLIAAVGLVRGGSAAWEPAAPPRGRPGGLAVAAVALAAAVQLWNGAHYPWQVSRIDAEQHAERLRQAAREWTPPPADQSFMAYHPPLYYWLGGAILRLGGGGGDEEAPERMRPVQLLGAGVAVAHLALAAWLLTRLGPPSRRARALALAVAGLSPVFLTVHPMLGNEGLTALLCGATFVAAALVLPAGGAWAGAGVGVLAGLALLTKYTGLMPLAVAVVLLGRRLAENGDGRRRAVATAASFLAATSVIAGPFYLSRWLRWGDPLVSNWLADTRFFAPYYEPGYRTLGFYARFGDVFRYLPERSLWSSWWDGIYANLWGEINDSYLPLGDLAVSTLLLVLFALALVPTLAGLAGFAITLRRSARGDGGLELGAVAITVFTLAAVSVYSLELPYQNSVKASYLLSLFVPATLFLARGYALAERGLGRWAWLLDTTAVLQVLLVLRLFVT